LVKANGPAHPCVPRSEARHSGALQPPDWAVMAWQVARKICNPLPRDPPPPRSPPVARPRHVCVTAFPGISTSVSRGLQGGGSAIRGAAAAHRRADPGEVRVRQGSGAAAAAGSQPGLREPAPAGRLQRPGETLHQNVFSLHPLLVGGVGRAGSRQGSALWLSCRTAMRFVDRPTGRRLGFVCGAGKAFCEKFCKYCLQRVKRAGECKAGKGVGGGGNDERILWNGIKRLTLSMTKIFQL